MVNALIAVKGEALLEYEIDTRDFARVLAQEDVDYAFLIVDQRRIIDVQGSKRQISALREDSDIEMVLDSMEKLTPDVLNKINRVHVDPLSKFFLSLYDVKGDGSGFKMDLCGCDAEVNLEEKESFSERNVYRLKNMTITNPTLHQKTECYNINQISAAIGTMAKASGFVNYSKVIEKCESCPMFKNIKKLFGK